MGDLEHALSAYENALRHNPTSVSGLTQVAGIARIKENYPKVSFPYPFLPPAFCRAYPRLFLSSTLQLFVSIRMTSDYFLFRLSITFRGCCSWRRTMARYGVLSVCPLFFIITIIILNVNLNIISRSLLPHAG